MASHPRAELAAEIRYLRKQQLESFADGVFSGWPPEQETAHNERGERLSRLVLELEALDAARSLCSEKGERAVKPPQVFKVIA